MQFQILSPLADFANLIAGYFAEIWGFLIFIGNISSFVVVLVGAILWFTEVNQKRGKGLVFSGILLAITVQYFVFFPPNFILQ
ncbi:hypothetical protein EU527_00250 [Candidatus Thorarchaeota archaeon]|nr:MAG: hypothetical protein EU527_00250 [Candidatus Thorarchaeota archaeon]